jgi:hypothetical protein
MKMDETLYGIAEKVKNFAVIYLVNILLDCLYYYYFEKYLFSNSFRLILQKFPISIRFIFYFFINSLKISF